MKANRKFVEAEEAVSPVIAVILMVAITVVLAATVFVLVSDIGSRGGDTAPAFELTQDEVSDKLTVASSVQSANWNRLEIRSDKVSIVMNEDGVNADNQTLSSATTWTRIDTASDPMNAGDYLKFCGSGGAKTDVTFEIRDLEANQIVKSGVRFSEIAAC